MRKLFRNIFLLLIITCFCFGSAYAASSTDESVLGNDRFSVTSGGNLVTNTNGGVFISSSEAVTTSTADPQGTGVASLTTLITNVTTSSAGASADVITLADGVNGQIKIINLVVDGETTGLAVTPATFVGSASATTDILLEDVGDSVTLVFDGTSWRLTSNIGGTLE